MIVLKQYKTLNVHENIYLPHGLKFHKTIPYLKIYYFCICQGNVMITLMLFYLIFGPDWQYKPNCNKK